MLVALFPNIPHMTVISQTQKGVPMYKLITTWTNSQGMPELSFWRDTPEEARAMGDRALSYNGCVAYTVTDTAGSLVCQRQRAAA